MHVADRWTPQTKTFADWSKEFIRSVRQGKNRSTSDSSETDFFYHYRYWYRYRFGLTGAYVKKQYIIEEWNESFTMPHQPLQVKRLHAFLSQKSLHSTEKHVFDVATMLHVL